MFLTLCSNIGWSFKLASQNWTEIQSTNLVKNKRWRKKEAAAKKDNRKVGPTDAPRGYVFLFLSCGSKQTMIRKDANTKATESVWAISVIIEKKKKTNTFPGRCRLSSKLGHWSATLIRRRCLYFHRSIRLCGWKHDSAAPNTRCDVIFDKAEPLARKEQRKGNRCFMCVFHSQSTTNRFIWNLWQISLNLLRQSNT